MKTTFVFLMLILLAACGPEDRPLKGGDNDPNGDNKIQESAYNGSQWDVASYSAYRILDAKRVLDTALIWQKKFKDNAGFDLKPGMQELKSCGRGSKGVYIDVLTHTEKALEFILLFNDCSILSNYLHSTKLFGKELFRVEFATLKHKKTKAMKRVVTSVDYETIGFHHELTANDRNLKFSNSSQTYYDEQRIIKIRHRPTGEYFYTYDSQGRFDQRLLSSSFDTLEKDGEHNFYSQGNFVVSRNKVRAMKHGHMRFKHQSDREVMLRSSGRSIFTNDRNSLQFIGMVYDGGLSFEKKCSFISGVLHEPIYVNENKNRNQFFMKNDLAIAGKDLVLSAKINKGTVPENLLVSTVNNSYGSSADVRCFLKTSNLQDVAQPKVPFDLLFVR